MWIRDRYFPTTYAQATWQRLAPFFRLPGRVTRGPAPVQVELRPFNDRQLNRDLVLLCERVNGAQPRLPDGRVLVLSISRGGGQTWSLLDPYSHSIAEIPGNRLWSDEVLGNPLQVIKANFLLSEIAVFEIASNAITERQPDEALSIAFFSVMHH